MVLLHEDHLRHFMQRWRLATALAVELPTTADPNYSSLGVLGWHVLSAAGGYLVWICQVLRLPDPGVRDAPGATAVAPDAENYLEHVLARWRAESLRSIADEQLETPEYPSEWQTRYSIDAMLEHAVMHPIRHTFQLDELIRKQQRS
jgi:hypothetical protein